MKSFALILSLLLSSSLSFQSCLNIDYKQLLHEGSVHFPQKDGVLILTSETIDEAIKTYPRLAVLMFAPWCPHCKEFYPEIVKALKDPEMKKMGVAFGRVDIEYNTKVSEEYNIRGMPTVIYFENGVKNVIYGGGRDHNNIVEWFHKKLISKTHNLQSLEEIKTYEKPPVHKFIYFGKNPERIKQYEDFIQQDDDTVFGLVKDEKLIKEYGKKPETLVLFKNFDDPPYVDIQNITKENINNEIKLNRFPLIFDDCNDLLNLMTIYRFPGLFLLRNEKDKEKTPAIDKTFFKLAKEHRTKLMFCKLDLADEMALRMIRVSNMTKASAEKNEPGILILDFAKGFNKFKSEDFFPSFTVENMEKFVNDYATGKIKPPIRSEEIPEKQEKAVYKLVNKSFKKEVLDSNINVFVKFYSPNCPHCVRLEPAFNELAEKLKYNKNLIVAEYNLIANDFDWFQIRGYPTLIMFKAGDKEHHITYEGNRTVEDMMNFVISNLGEVKEQKEDKKIKEEEKKKKEEEDKKKKEEEEKKKRKAEEEKKRKEEEEKKRKAEEEKKRKEEEEKKKKAEEEKKKKAEEKRKKKEEEKKKKKDEKANKN
jgi:protein disulfide-isomerase A1